MTSVDEVQTAPVVQRRALWWLVLIVAIALGLRLEKINGLLQTDEYGPLFAIADRPGGTEGFTPPASQPLAVVNSWQDVRDRSLFPYGITNPAPLYHYLLYWQAHVLPIAEWSLRVPSVLAGLGCVVAIYGLCRRLFGVEAALLAALLTAVDRMQITASTVARPYALGNLCFVVSFLSLFGILESPRHRVAASWALLYGLLFGLMAYLNPVLMVAGTAHGAVVLWWLWQHRIEHAQHPGQRAAVLWWMAGCFVAAALFFPQLAYTQAVGEFYRTHREYLRTYGAPRLGNVLVHNGTLLLVWPLTYLTEGVVRRILQWRTAWQNPQPDTESSATVDHRPEDFIVSDLARHDDRATTRRESMGTSSRDGLVAAWCWLLVPQIAAIFLGVLGQSIYLSRYLCYTPLAGFMLLAVWATQHPQRERRYGMMLATTITFIAAGFMPFSEGYYLNSRQPVSRTAQELINLEKRGQWEEGDLFLLHPAFLEADFFLDHNSGKPPLVVELLASPISSLHVAQKAKPFLLLSFSHYRNASAWHFAGQRYLAREKFYNEVLAAKLRVYKRFWLGNAPVRFQRCFLPWLANALDCSLKVTVLNPSKTQEFRIPARTRPDDFIVGLDDRNSREYVEMVLIEPISGP